MWFDPRAAQSEIKGHPTATSATTATKAEPARSVSRLSQVSQPREVQKPAFNVAKVASVATPSTPETKHKNETAGGRVTTWTGRVVSLDEWRNLSTWERLGTDGRHWCGIAQAWIEPKG